MSETKITRLLCQGCGADLDVSDGVRFVTCNYCSAKLEVVRDDSTTHTRVLEEVAGDVKVIRMQNELERIDREWEAEKAKFILTGQNGGKHLPSKKGAALNAVIAIVFGLIVIGMGAFIGSFFVLGGSAFLIFGFLIVGLGIMSAVGGSAKAERYEKVRARYDARRSELVEKLDVGN